MGREVRKVPADWQHPKRFNSYHAKDIYVGLMNGFAKDLADWNAENEMWEKGFQKNYGSGPEWVPIEDPMTFEEWHGEKPIAGNYMPEWPEEQKTHYMMYETCSEGTPISPAFATPEELAQWLDDTGASSFGDMTATYEQWLACIHAGSAPSAVIVGGVMKSGVEVSSN